LVNELGTKSLLHVSGDNGKERTTVIGELGGPMGLVAAPAGSVYLTEAFSGQVSKIDAGGQKTVIAKDLKMPEGVALAADGKLIVAEVGAKRIVEIDPATGSVTEIAGNLPIGLPGNPNIPTGVGVGASGTIYFSSDVENTIYKITKK
jgi:outer membrane protein assembly factor BamB